jgi:hypothetical protein
MHRRLLQVVVALIAFALASVGVGVANAEQASEKDTGSSADSVKSDRGALKKSGGQGEALAAPSPAGCVGRANNPHKTGNSVKGVTQTDCLEPVPRLRATSQLWRHRWWGYEKVGSKGNNTNYNSWQVKASGLFSPCQTNSWRTEGEHWSYETSGTYYFHSMKYADVSC